MKCPGCNANVSSARPVCARCGATLPSGPSGTTPAEAEAATAPPVPASFGTPPQAEIDFGEPPAVPWGTPPAGTGTAPPGDARRRAPGKAVLLSAALVAGAIAVGGGVGKVLSSHRSATRTAATAPASAPQAGAVPPSPSGDPQTQAEGVNALLSSGKKAHDRLQYSADTCDQLAAAVPKFKRIVSDRQQEWSEAQRLPLDQLPQATELRQALVDTYRYSLTADRAYLAWAQAAKSQDCGGSPPPHNSDLADAQAADDLAAPAKRRLIGMWDSIAQSQSLPTYTWQDL